MYGMPTPEEQLASLKHEEQEGEVDVNLQEYKKRRDEARRSPYPSVIVEVMSTPPPDFGSRRDEAVAEAAARDTTGSKAEEDADVTSDDVRRLEALFAMSAAKKSSSADDPFYDALGEVCGDPAISFDVTRRHPTSRNVESLLNDMYLFIYHHTPRAY
jgi:hypothetical protein